MSTSGMCSRAVADSPCTDGGAQKPSKHRKLQTGSRCLYRCTLNSGSGLKVLCLGFFLDPQRGLYRGTLDPGFRV